jgi:ankyrin repeat protein
MYTPLHHAANRGHIAVIRQLLEAGADVNKKNKAAEAALHLAAYNGNLTVVEMLLDKEAIIDCLNEDGDTPLFFGSRKNHPAVVRLLMQRGADATVTNRYGDVAVDEARQKRTQEAFAAEKLGDEGQAILGHDLVLRMFGFLSAKELSRSACVCGRWHRVVSSR